MVEKFVELEYQVGSGAVETCLGFYERCCGTLG